MAAAAQEALAIVGARKCAVLLSALGEDISARLLKHLTEDEVKRITGAVAELGDLADSQIHEVLYEFRAETAKPKFGGMFTAARLLTAAFGPEEGKKRLEELPRPTPTPAQMRKDLGRLNPQLLARFVQNEHPQTIALIMAHLSSKQAAEVLRAIDPVRRREVVIRLARLEKVSPVTMSRITTVVSKKIREFGELKRESSGGLRSVAEILNQLDNDTTDNLLKDLRDLDSVLVDAIQQKMFLFEDLLKLDGSAIKELLGRADRRLLTVALKGASEELRTHLLKGMSQRGAAMLLEDMEAQGALKLREVEAAQQQIISVLRQLESEGVVSLKAGGGGDDQVLV